MLTGGLIAFAPGCLYALMHLQNQKKQQANDFKKLYAEA